MGDDEMTISLTLCVPSTGAHDDAITSWRDTSNRPLTIIVDDAISGPEAGYLQKLQAMYKQATDASVIGYLHSDLFILEHAWNDRVLSEFEDERVAVVSFFGARRLGSDDLYKVPYATHLLARGDCVSNMIDAERHGARMTGECDVAMIDSFSCFVRRSFLDELGGWPVGTYEPSHCSDMWICAQAARHQRKVRMVGVACKHTSGGVRGDGSFDYAEWCKTTRLGSDQAMHAFNHQRFYDEFRDVLPIRVRS